jgi:hypothetical protein
VKKKQQIGIPKPSKLFMNLKGDVLAMELFGGIEFKELITFGRVHHSDFHQTLTN